jgi:hypothetical protein
MIAFVPLATLQSLRHPIECNYFAVSVDGEPALLSSLLLSICQRL